MTNTDQANHAAPSPTNSEAVRSGDWVGPEEARRSYIRRRGETAQRIADKLGVSVERVFAEWRRAERAQMEWMKALDAMGYKPGEDPVAFLRRVNASDEGKKGPTDPSSATRHAETHK